MKVTLITLSVVGMLLYSILFVVTFQSKANLEKYAGKFIESVIIDKTEREIDRQLNFKANSKVSRLANKLLKSKEKELEAVKLRMKDHLANKVGFIVAEVRDLNCECRKKYEAMIDQSLILKSLSLKTAIRKIENFAKSKYMQVALELKRDLRIFTLTNILMFLVLLVISFAKPQTIKHLFFPAILLFASTLICSYFYLFKQNWFLTIVYSDYLGFWYAGYLFLVFLFLCDILLNSARITTKLLNAFFNAIGSAVSFTPC